ncbi:MAG TPA: SDR family oxidoreductase [Solirubrobacterales bacterium]|nr:SDR family oxidoreductase [Solirubrobacterales bacterium]
MDLDYLGDLFGLTDRVAVVTGARHGLGRSLALALGRAGARVVVTGREREALDPLLEELREIGVDAHAVALEVTDPKSVERGVEEAARWGGRLDVVINNAGLSIRRAATDYEVDEWDAVLDTNLRGAFLVARAAIDHMGSGGRIVSLSSTFAVAARAERAPYAASKAGLEQLTRVLALEWAPRGVTVNAVAPGATPTETRQELLAGDLEQRTAEFPLGRLGRAEDVVGAVLLLCGDAGAFITGQTLRIDGGYTLGGGA